ncbi:MAG: energy transducer TonB [Ignavibacteriaceae bacterium]|jgi:protein TonB
MKTKSTVLIPFIFVMVSIISQFAISNTRVMEEPQEDPYAAFAEVMPEPVGGLEAIIKKIVYPEIAKKAGLSGKLYLLIYVDEKGKVDDVKVIKGLGGGCDEAAIKAVKESKFSPGKNSDVPVKVKLSLPITFKMR